MDGDLFDSTTGFILYEFYASIEDDIRDGSLAITRFDNFKKYFEMLFEKPVDTLDSLESEISNDEELVNYYEIIRNKLAYVYDTHFGISINDLENITLFNLYEIYQIIYLEFIQFLCIYAIGKIIISRKSPKKALEEAELINETESVGIADTLLGAYIFDEDEFSDENIITALEAADPGNELYKTLFGEAGQMYKESPDAYRIPVISNIAVNNIAFRLKVKTEYLKPGMKDLIEQRLITIINSL
jgi:hypothetical protein